MQSLEHIEQMIEMTRRLVATARTRLGIGFVASTLYGYLPEAIRRYRNARPEVEITLHEMTSLEQIVALKEGRIDVGFGRIPHDDPMVNRVLMRNERLMVALPGTHALAARAGPLRLADLAGLPLIVYPKAPRPSYADQVLALLRAQDLRPPFVHEVKELQTALGLVAAESGFALVPASVERLRRDNVFYTTLDEPDALSPIIIEQPSRRSLARDRPDPQAHQAGSSSRRGHCLRALSLCRDTVPPPWCRACRDCVKCFQSRCCARPVCVVMASFPPSRVAAPPQERTCGPPRVPG